MTSWSRLAARIGIGAFVTVVVAILVGPTLILVPASLSKTATLLAWPKSVSLDWYRAYFTSSGWVDATLNSVWIALTVALLSVCLGTPIALGMVRGKLAGGGFVTALVLSPAIVPTVVTALGMYFVLVQLGLVGTMVGFVLAHTVLALPLVVVTISAVAATLDQSLEAAAASLGANGVNVFLRVVLPVLLPGILGGALYGFITSWDELIVAIFISSPAYQTLPVEMWNSTLLSPNPTIAAVSVLLILLVLAALTAYSILRRVQKHSTNRNEAQFA